jgi:hypothetical protein
LELHRGGFRGGVPTVLDQWVQDQRQLHDSGVRGSVPPLPKGWECVGLEWPPKAHGVIMN